jgi:uncharacterized protein (TIGR02996 family)
MFPVALTLVTLRGRTERVYNTSQPIMNDHKAFLDVIIANPQDDVVRLVYADWLEENGEPERAEFIRLQIKLHQLELQTLQFNPQRELVNPTLLQLVQDIEQSKKRELELLKENNYLKLLGIEPVDLPARFDQNGDLKRFYHLEESWITRGFLSTLKCYLIQFLRDAGKVAGWRFIAKHPITDLYITDKAPTKYNRFMEKYRYCFTLLERTDFNNFADDWLPLFLFDFLSGHVNESTPGTTVIEYETEELGSADLSRACLAWARSVHYLCE